METYIEPRELTANPNFSARRRKTLAGLSDDMIDAPILDLIKGFNSLPCCFTLQCCFGHFVYNGQEDPNNLEPLPGTDTIEKATYRIAYICFCIENSAPGRKLFEALKRIPDIDPDNIQFCCAEWFWKQQVNTYALQVEPDRYKRKDSVTLDYREALHIEKIRNVFFIQLRALLQKQK